MQENAHRNIPGFEILRKAISGRVTFIQFYQDVRKIPPPTHSYTLDGDLDKKYNLHISEMLLYIPISIRILKIPKLSILDSSRNTKLLFSKRAIIYKFSRKYWHLYITIFSFTDVNTHFFIRIIFYNNHKAEVFPIVF